MIKIENLNKSYKSRKNLISRGEEIDIFNNLNISIPLNSFTAVTGLNGSGKTTLFKILSGYTSMDSGTITINNLDYLKYIKKNRVFLISSEDRSFYYRLTISQNLKFFANIFNIFLTQEEIDEKLDFLGLIDKKNSFYYELSTGMKQKLSLARALLIKPDILILDEMERGIDSIMLEKIFNYLVKLKDITIIYSTHQKKLVDRADFVIRLEK